MTSPQHHNIKVSALKRLAVIFYETLLVIGILFLVTFTTTFCSKLLGTNPQPWTQIVMLLSVGMYFSWSWSNGRQTLAMRTWKVKLVHQQNPSSTPSPLVACIRYLAILLPWIVVQVIVVWQETRGSITHLDMIMRGGWIITAFIFPWAWALLHPQRLPFHDALSRTELILQKI
jgi:uncharacterized RDD family membrane protein YckC